MTIYLIVRNSWGEQFIHWLAFHSGRLVRYLNQLERCLGTLQGEVSALRGLRGLRFEGRSLLPIRQRLPETNSHFQLECTGTGRLNAQGRDTGLALFFYAALTPICAALSSQFHFLDLGAKKPYIAITSRAKALPGGRPIH